MEHSIPDAAVTMPAEVALAMADATDSICPPDLDLSISPATCTGDSFMNEYIVKDTILNVAALVYEHEKNTQMWAKQVSSFLQGSERGMRYADPAQCSDGNNQLLWFINRVYVGGDTSFVEVQTSTVDDQNLLCYLGLEDWTQQKVYMARYVELSMFEDLYYMTIAKVRELFESLQVRLKSGFITHDNVLLERSWFADSYGPVTVGTMLIFLKTQWGILMQPDLMFTLDHAVRNSNAVMSYMFSNDEDYAAHQAQAVGLWDFNRMSVAELAMRVWRKNSAVVEEELIHDAAKKRDLAIERAESRYLKTVETIKGRAIPGSEVMQDVQQSQCPMQQVDENTPPLAPPLPCVCFETCFCKTICMAQPFGHCMCYTNQLFTDIMIQADTDMEARNMVAQEQGQVVGQDYLFGASTNELAQMQVATAAFDNHPMMTNAVVAMHQQNEEEEDNLLGERTANEHGGSIVPPQRKQKDKYPLDFYGTLKAPAMPCASDQDYRGRYDSVHPSAMMNTGGHGAGPSAVMNNFGAFAGPSNAMNNFGAFTGASNAMNNFGALAGPSNAVTNFGAFAGSSTAMNNYAGPATAMNNYNTFAGPSTATTNYDVFAGPSAVTTNFDVFAGPSAATTNYGVSDVGPSTPRQLYMTEHIGNSANSANQPATSSLSNTLLASPFSHDAYSSSPPAPLNPTPSRRFTSNPVANLELLSRPLHERRYYSAGGTMPLEQRPEVTWQLPPPAAETFNMPARDLMRVLPAVPQLPRTERISSDSNAKSSGGESYEAKEGDSGKKGFRNAIRGGVTKLFHKGAN